MRIKIFGYIMLLLAVIVTSSTTVAYVFASNINAIQLALLISTVGTAFSFVLMVAKGKQSNLRGILRNRTQLLSTVGCGIFIYTAITLIFSIATHSISAALVSVIYRTWPLMLIAMAPFALRERITKWDAVAVAIGFAGLVVTLVGNTSVALPAAAIPFVGLVLLAALSDTIGSIIEKRYSFEAYSSIFVFNLASMAALLLIAGFYGQVTLAGINTTDIYAIAFLGIFQNVLLTFFFMNSLRILKTALASNAYLITPFITMVLGYLLLGQPILPVYIFVAGSVFAGIAIQQLAPKAGNYITTSKSKNRDIPFMAPALYDVTGAFVNTKNKKLYDMLKGNGRVLAFNKGSVDPEIYRKLIDSENAKKDGSVLLTNKTHREHFAAEELNHLKELMNHGDDDLVFIGAGHPELVEKKLFALHDSFEADSEEP